jgi:hypothetical protein
MVTSTHDSSPEGRAEWNRRIDEIAAQAAEWRREVEEVAAQQASEQEGWRVAARTCTVIASMVSALSDRIPTVDMRERIMRPLLPALIGTIAPRETMLRRAYIAADFAVREATPAALDACGLCDAATQIRALSPIIDSASADRASRAAYAAAYAAAAVAEAADDAETYYASYAAASYAAAAASYAAADDAVAAVAASAASAANAAAEAAAYDANGASAADAMASIYRLAADCIRRMCEVK